MSDRLQPRFQNRTKRWLAVLIMMAGALLQDGSWPQTTAATTTFNAADQRISEDTQGLQEQLLAYMENPKSFGIANCVGFFSDDWEKLKSAVSRLKFYDVTSHEVGQIKLSELNVNSRLTLRQLYLQMVRDVGVAILIVPTESGGISPHVVLGTNFYHYFDPNSNTSSPMDLGMQNALLFHELLHYFYQLPDIDLANRLGLGAIPDMGFASRAISKFIQSGHPYHPET